MFIQLKSHKAHVFTKNDIDPSKRTIVMIPGAGMDHRTLSMFKLDKIKDDVENWVIDYDHFADKKSRFKETKKKLIK